MTAAAATAEIFAANVSAARHDLQQQRSVVEQALCELQQSKPIWPRDCFIDDMPASNQHDVNQILQPLSSLQKLLDVRCVVWYPTRSHAAFRGQWDRHLATVVSDSEAHRCDEAAGRAMEASAVPCGWQAPPQPCAAAWAPFVGHPPTSPPTSPPASPRPLSPRPPEASSTPLPTLEVREET